MPLQKLQFRPGINREMTTYANEGGYYSCDKIRFRSSQPEKIGGWINQSTYTYDGVCRSLFNWVTFSNENLLGLGTNQKFYVELFGVYHDITPVSQTISLPANPFATTLGSYAVTVTTSTPHNISTGTYVLFSGVTGTAAPYSGIAVNGVTIQYNSLDNPYAPNNPVPLEVIATPTSTSFVVRGFQVATSTGSGGGSTAVATVYLSAGNAVFSLGLGWGNGEWGFGGWGIGSITSSQIRLWSQDNDNENLILNPRGGSIYYWDKDTTSWPRAITLNAYANTQVKTVTEATFLTGASSITVVDPNGIDTGAVISGTGIAAGTYVTTAYVAGSTTVPISAVTTSGSSGSYTFSYSGRHVPNSTYKIATSSAGNFCIAFGSNPYSPINFSESFDPLLIRWSDADNPFEWVPSTTNQSGETRLSYGSYIVTSTDTRQEILVWTDAAIFSMQYLGPPYVWSVNLLLDNISIASPNAAFTVNNVTYWMGVDKFYVYSGRVETLPCALRQFIFTNINTDQLAQIVCGSNEGYNEVWWFYPTADSLVNNRYVIYNYVENTWAYGGLERGYWLDSPLRQFPMAAFSCQKSFLSDAISSTDTVLPIVNAASYPNEGVVTIDLPNAEKIYYTGKTSSSLTGCIRGYDGTTATSHIQYSVVTPLVPNQVMNHEYGNDDRSTTEILPIEAYIESADFDIGDGHNFGFVWRILPDLTFVGSSSNTPAVTLTVKARQNSGTPYGAGDTPTVQETTTIPIELYTGQVYTRIRGRQMAFRLASSDLGVAWQMGAMRIDIRPDGRR
jgi:hypothetical protein